MKKLLSLLSMFGIMVAMVSLYSCEEDSDPVPGPSVTAPAAASTDEGSSINLTFTYEAEGGFASSSVSATGGSAVVATDGVADATTGSIVVSFTAATAGAGSVILTITDGEGNTDEATAVITIAEDPDGLTISAPAATTVSQIGTVEVTFTFVAETGFASSVVEAEGGEATITTNGTADATAGSIVVSFVAGTEVGPGSITLTITDSDAQTQAANAVIVIEEYPTEVISFNIDEDVTWTAGTIYELGGRITVLDGATLTIEAGVIVKGQAGSGSNATALMVARGGRLVADGEVDAPIIFTAASDEILPGQIESPNLAVTETGLWGGIVILGYANIYAATEEAQIEGVPTSDTNGLFGGDDDTDDSGILRYVSIRHGGTVISGGNEINGLSMGGVGSGTIIENIEIVSNVDDGIEIWGGMVDLTNVLVWSSSDDALDTDYGYGGTISNFMIIDPVNGGSGFELDGPEAFTGTLPAGTCFTIENGVVYAPAAYNLVDWDSDTNGEVKDVYFFGMPTTQTIAATDATADANDGPVKSYNGSACGTSDGWEATTTGVTIAEVFGSITVSEVTLSTRTVGPDAADFAWTLCATSGKLAEIGL